MILILHLFFSLQVDSSEKLSRLLGSATLESCALIQRVIDAESETELLTNSELELIDFCEEYWDAPMQPVIKIPDK